MSVLNQEQEDQNDSASTILSSVTGFSRLEFVSAVVSILQRGLHDKKGQGICEKLLQVLLFIYS